MSDEQRILSIAARHTAAARLSDAMDALREIEHRLSPNERLHLERIFCSADRAIEELTQPYA